MSAVTKRPVLLLCAALAAVGLIAACSDGGGTSTPATPAPVATTAVSGSVIKGPVNGANVCAFKAVAAGKGDQLACTTTNSTGGYTLNLEYMGDVVIEASGGTYIDEATNVSTPLSTPLQVVIASNGSATTGMVTPLTSVAYSISKGLTGGVSSANFGTASSTVATQFQLGTGVNVATLAPTFGAAANAYGKALQAFSKYVANGGSFAAFVTWANPSSFAAAYSSAYVTINGNGITFTFTGTGIPGSSTGGTESCGITVSASGTVTTNGLTIPVNLPPTKICITGVPAGTCSAGNANLNSLAAAGSTPGAGYSLNYTYAYAAGDCSGALVTVNYQ
ncbi:hypothetical protein [Caenimonas sp. SL110]|uniref:hypothetical protein n=1 Tax=Caenimonas sp. SL110 TaxID=1450524 RepID=UPI0006535BA7|nr:hypothetical protein [Caenimonas sp. SL110]